MVLFFFFLMRFDCIFLIERTGYIVICFEIGERKF